MYTNYKVSCFMDGRAEYTLREGYRSGSMSEVFRLIELTGKQLKQIQRETIRDTDLTPPQYFVLTLLWDKDGRAFKELAGAVGCSRATMTGIADTLERKGLVTREPNPHDRRSLLVKLTERGRALRETTPTLDTIFKRCCVGLEPDEVRQLSRLLKRLNESLG
jgi:DNA-binding MarR family transcriptional regulator